MVYIPIYAMTHETSWIKLHHEADIHETKNLKIKTSKHAPSPEAWRTDNLGVMFRQVAQVLHERYRLPLFKKRIRVENHLIKHKRWPHIISIETRYVND